ncbi:MAG: hypothetical protein ACR652_02035 [Methylocystis sp.]|uniref:hypothetical protein n=1 Tax=Methylocystis sp. TaxID=1911079 RepID=UPI003DA423D7
MATKVNRPVAWPHSPAARRLYARGAGRWMLAAGDEGETMPRGLNGDRINPDAPDPRFPAEAQFDLRVEGSSVDKLAREGELLRCVDVDGAGLRVATGDIVVIERQRGEITELIGKRVLRQGDALELWSESTLDYWREPVIRHHHADRADPGPRIIGKVLYAHRPR